MSRNPHGKADVGVGLDAWSFYIAISVVILFLAAFLHNPQMPLLWGVEQDRELKVLEAQNFEAASPLEAAGTGGSGAVSLD